MKRPLALLIDLDDTLIDSTASADRRWRQTAEAFALEVGHSADAIESALAEARVWYWSCPERNLAGRLDLDKARADVVDMGFQTLGVSDYGLAERFAVWYTQGRVDAIRPFDGAFEAVAKLKADGFKLGLITNGQDIGQRAKVEAFGLPALFEVVLIEGELGYGKPQPRVYQEAMAGLGVQAQDTWMVGDNLAWEVGVPQKLGMTGIWVDWRGKGLPVDSQVKPDATIRSVAELPGLIEEVTKAGQPNAKEDQVDGAGA